MRISDWSSDVCSSDLAGHEVQRHARLQLGGVAAAQAHGALAPVGRVAEADRIAGAVVLHDAVARQHVKEGLGDFLAAPPRPRLAETRFPALPHPFLCLTALVRRTLAVYTHRAWALKSSAAPACPHHH